MAPSRRGAGALDPTRLRRHLPRGVIENHPTQLDIAAQGRLGQTRQRLAISRKQTELCGTAQLPGRGRAAVLQGFGHAPAVLGCKTHHQQANHQHGRQSRRQPQAHPHATQSESHRMPSSRRKASVNTETSGTSNPKDRHTCSLIATVKPSARRDARPGRTTGRGTPRPPQHRNHLTPRLRRTGIQAQGRPRLDQGRRITHHRHPLSIGRDQHVLQGRHIGHCTVWQHQQHIGLGQHGTQCT